ncbi:MAG TPA: M20/M25/M40 family metallo-hydrolase [Polyangiaceae bacterium]
MRPPVLRLALCTLPLLACDSPKASAPPADAKIAAAPESHAKALPLPDADAGSYAPAEGTIAIAQRIAGTILVGGHVMDYERALAEDIGARMTGSEGLNRAAAWAEDAFRKAGIETVAHESFPLSATWTRHPVTARAVAPVERPLHAEAVAWLQPTPREGVRGDAVYVSDLSPNAKGTPDVKGKIVLIDRDSRKGLNKKVDYVSAVTLLAKRGPLAIVSIGGRDNDVLGAGSWTRGGSAGDFVGFILGKEDGAWIKRQLEHGTVTLALSNDSPVGPPAQVPNVIAELKGRESPDEWVLLGAHLDSWDFAQGAQDNGTGSAAVLEAARAIAALKTPPRRSIRFALWAGEEQGLLGSRAYVAAHKAELDRAVYVLNTDHGSGPPKGWELATDPQIAPFHALTSPLLGTLSGDETKTDPTCSTDHCSFMVEGVPTANLLVDDSHYDEIHHTPGDTLEKVSASALAEAAAIVAVTAYALADAPARLSKRQGHAAVGAMLKKAGVADELASEGIWKP